MKEEYDLNVNEYVIDRCPECLQMSLSTIDAQLTHDDHCFTKQCDECKCMVYESYNLTLGDVGVEPWGSEYNKDDK